MPYMTRGGFLLHSLLQVISIILTLYTLLTRMRSKKNAGLF